jgi:hypothetical protein
MTAGDRKASSKKDRITNGDGAIINGYVLSFCRIDSTSYVQTLAREFTVSTSESLSPKESENKP